MYYKGDTLSRVANKLKREVLRLPGVRVVTGYAHLEALEAHSIHLPPLDPRDLSILEGVRRNGVHVVPVDSLGFEETPATFAALTKLVDELRAMPTQGDNQPRLSAARMMEFPEVYLWGTNERLLNLIENYIGLPLWYHGVDIRREVADNKPSDVRQWHIDAEDRRMFRIIVYLNDVEPGGGPFQYIPREKTVQAAKKLHYGSGFVNDEQMTRVIPRPEWVEVTGKARTAAFADTCRVFHRAQPPRIGDRYSITFSWTSRTPLKTYPTTPLSDGAYAFVSSRINERQRSALPDRNENLTR
jgi:hypothetical protein